MTKQLYHYSSLLFLILFAFSCSNNQDKKELDKKDKSKTIKSSLFEKVNPTKSKIHFSNVLRESEKLNIINYHYFYNGGGVACGDINNDGLIDLFFTANQLPDKLYLNKGNLEFEDISASLPQEVGETWSTGVSMVDINNDGLLDIYICKSGRLSPKQRKNRLLINQGDLSFKDEAAAYGLDDAAYSTQASFFDYDKDGDLDLFLLNHEIEDIMNYNKETRALTRNQDSGDKLYRNDGDKFIEVGEEAGIYANPYGFGLGVAIGDLNNDSWPDIYVTNDFLENDYMYINNMDGTFKETIHASTKHISNYGMGVDIADINNDGMQDILVVDMVAKDNFRQKTNMSGMNPERFWQCINFGFHYQYMYNTLQLNQGNEKFSEVGKLAGISNTDWSWAALMVDLDFDGSKDIFITNGMRKEVRNNDFVSNYILEPEKQKKFAGLSPAAILKTQLQAMPSHAVGNYIFKNNSNINFTDVSSDWGINQPSFSTGAAYADLDNDGDLDLIVNNIDDTSSIYKNTSNEKKLFNYSALKLKGNATNINGIGSKIKLYSDGKPQLQELYSTRGFQSSVSDIAYFGLGQSKSIDSIIVEWYNGTISKLIKPESNQLLEVDFKNATKIEQQVRQEKLLLTERTRQLGINFLHQENTYDDFKDQVLLPHKLSTQGPALAVGDLNGDGLEDFFVGGANGFSSEIFIQNRNGVFTKKTSSVFKSHAYFEDVNAVFFDADNDTDLDLYINSGGYEFNLKSDSLIDRLYLNDGKGNFNYQKNSLPEIAASTGSAKPFDYDNDGDLDLFIGGRMIPKRYPNSPSSYILQNENGVFSNVTNTIAPDLENIGMVTDAEWLDLNNDKKVELVLVGEWMPITVLSWNGTQFILENSTKNGLAKTDGWWFSLEKIDFDNDGDLDLIVGNLGLNYKYQTNKDNPFKVFGKDFDNNETVDIVLSYEQKGTYYPVRGRECSSEQLPFIKDKFPNYNSFGNASVYDILGENQIQDSIIHNAYTFATTLFINDNGKFNARELEYPVQLSSINDIVVTDVNKDGFDDVLMGGNLYNAEVETPRNDAGYGNLLLNINGASFDYVSPKETSFFGEGNVKKIKLIKLSNNESAILVAQNAGLLRLFSLTPKKK